MIRVYAALIALAALVGVSIGSTWWLTRDHYLAEIATLKAEHATELATIRDDAAKKVAEANKRTHAAAQKYEDWKRKQRPKVITITKEIERVLEIEREWSGTPVPERVREQLARAGADLGATEPDPAVPDGAVPAAGAPEPSDQRRPGAVVPDGPAVGE